MQGSLPQPILPIENKTSDRVVSERSQKDFKKRSKNLKFDFSEDHNFL